MGRLELININSITNFLAPPKCIINDDGEDAGGDNGDDGGNGGDMRRGYGYQYYPHSRRAALSHFKSPGLCDLDLALAGRATHGEVDAKSQLQLGWGVRGWPQMEEVWINMLLGVCFPCILS